MCSYLAVRPLMLWDPLQVSCHPLVCPAWSCHLRHWVHFLFSTLPQWPGQFPLPLALSQTWHLRISACQALGQHLLFSSALQPWLTQTPRHSLRQTLSFRVLTHLTRVQGCPGPTTPSSPYPWCTKDIQALW